MKYCIDDLDLNGKRLLIRVDFNVPLDEHGKVADDTRVRAALPTINYAVGHGAKVILISHLGRPKGGPSPKLSLAPVAVRLSTLLGRPVEMGEDCVGPGVKGRIDRMGAGQVLMLENCRFHPEEEKNDDAFARALADHRGCDEIRQGCGVRLPDAHGARTSGRRARLAEAPLPRNPRRSKGVGQDRGPCQSALERE